MSDYANLQEKYYYAMNPPPPPEGGATMSRDGMADVLRREMEAYKNRNPDPKPEPALLYARTQAEWHLAQQALIDSQTSPEALMLSQGMVEGTDAAAQQGEKVQEQRKKDAEARLNNAKRDLEEMRKGEFRAGGIGRSGLPPASTPGTVPAPVQGQIPPNLRDAAGDAARPDPAATDAGSGGAASGGAGEPGAGGLSAGADPPRGARPSRPGAPGGGWDARG